MTKKAFVVKRTQARTVIANNRNCIFCPGAVQSSSGSDGLFPKDILGALTDRLTEGKPGSIQ